MTIPSDYAVRIKRLRQSLGMTQTEFAETIGVAFVTVNRWENNHYKPTPLAWMAILKLALKP